MTISTERLQEMLAACDGTTTGLWSVEVDEFDERAYISTAERRDSNIMPVAGVDICFNEPVETEQQRNAAHISNCSPLVVSEIITELLASRSAGAEGREAAAYERGRRDILNALLELNPKAAHDLHIVSGGAEESFTNQEGKLPFDVVFWVASVAEQIGIAPKENSDAA